MVLHRYGDFRVEVFYFDSPCIHVKTKSTVNLHYNVTDSDCWMSCCCCCCCWWWWWWWWWRWWWL